jgi:MFS family permease
MLLNHEESLNKKKIKVIEFFSFLTGFAQAVMAYIMSSYFKESLHTENFGIYYSIAYILVLISLLNFHKIIKKFGKSDVFFATFLAKIIILGFLSTSLPSIFGAVLLVLYIILGSVNAVSLDSILESFSVDGKSGRIRGMHLMILDAGFVLGPILSTQLLEAFNFQVVFVASLVIDAAALLFMSFGLGKINEKFRRRETIINLIKKAFKRKDIMRIYYISFVLEFFYTLMVIYTPIYLLDLGMSWEKIGIIFTIMLLPFVILPYPAGFLADKKWGEKNLLIGAIFIMGVSTFYIYFINSTTILIWSSIMFATRIGASLIQTLRDSYFYKRIDGKDVDLIDFYRTSLPVAYMLAPAVSAVALLMGFPLKMMFIIVAVVVLSALYPAFRLANNHCEADV